MTAVAGAVMWTGAKATGWTVIDLGGSGSVCAVSVRMGARSGGRPQVVAAVELPCAADADSHPTLLRQLMSGVDRKLPVLVTLARGQYQLRVLPTPTVPPRELLASLRWTLGAEDDHPAQDLNVAWMPIPADVIAPGRPPQGYAVTVSSAWLNARLALWRQAGVKPSVVDVRETALRNLAGALEGGSESVALLCIDGDGIAVVFTHQGSLYLDRHISQMLAVLQTAEGDTRERLLERIAVQLMRSADMISRSYPFMPVPRLVLALAPELQGLAEFLAEQLPLKVALLALEQVFDLDAVPELQQSSALQSRCLVALGAALRDVKAAS